MTPTLPPQSFLHLQKDGAVLVDVHVIPNAARTQIQGLHDGALRVRLHAPPVDGKANLALQAWLAETLGVPRSALELVRGATARRKQLRVAARHATQARWQGLLPSPGG
ncbi:MAG: DUF167 domain-containing protein [Hylemonella sp.]|nr:DUF167 domain-containing protein [Hylemonella sp.]